MCIVGCSTNNKVSFSDGESLSVYIGEERMLPFTTENKLSSNQKGVLSSSDPSIVEISDNGYIFAKSEGIATITVSITNTKLKDTIKVSVIVPQTTEEQTYVMNVDGEQYPRTFVEVSDDVPVNTRLYAIAKKDDKTVGQTTALVPASRKIYFDNAQLGIENGIYNIGLAFIDYAEGQIENVYLTDVVQAVALAKEENWTFYNAELNEEGALSIVNTDILHGGASVVLDIEVDGNGKILNPYIQISAVSGNIWSAKIRRGDGVDNLYEEIILNDVSVSVTSSCTIDLNKYPSYVRGEKVTIVVYTVEGELKLNDILNYSDSNRYNRAIQLSKYVPLESVKLSVPEKTRVGETYKISVNYTPKNASFKAMQFFQENDTIEINDRGEFTVLKVGSCKIAYVSFDGKEYGSVVVNNTVKVETLEIFGTANSAIVGVETESYDLKSLIKLYPDNATIKDVKFKIQEDTTGSASVDENGVIAFSKTGSVVVRVTSIDNLNVWEDFTLQINATVKKALSVSFSVEQTQLKIGEQLLLTAKVLPDDATYQDVVFLSSNESVLRIENDYLIAVAVGSASVLAISEDGAAYTQVSIDVKAISTYNVNPTESSFAILELDDKVLTDDEVIVFIYKGDEKIELIRKTISLPETDANAFGSMEMQRRLLIPISSDIFSSADVYTFELLVLRNGENLNDYTFGTLSFVKQIEDITSTGWQDGFGAIAQNGESLQGVLDSDGYGYIYQTVERTDLIDNSFLLVDVATHQAEKIAVKIRIGDIDYTLTTGDCSAIGVYKLDMNDAELQAFLANSDSFQLCIYIIGEKGETVQINKIVFVSK